MVGAARVVIGAALADGVGAAKNGGRDRDRTCDPSRVKGVRYRCATRPRGRTYASGRAGLSRVANLRDQEEFRTSLAFFVALAARTTGGQVARNYNML